MILFWGLWFCFAFCDSVLKFVFLFWGLWFCFGFCDSGLSFVILFWVLRFCFGFCDSVLSFVILFSVLWFCFRVLRFCFQFCDSVLFLSATVLNSYSWQTCISQIQNMVTSVSDKLLHHFHQTILLVLLALSNDESPKTWWKCVSKGWRRNFLFLMH